MSQAMWLKENFEIKKKKKPHFEEKNNEIVIIFGGFGQISSFLLLKLPYLPNRF
jgi:hypothetical protein